MKPLLNRYASLTGLTIETMVFQSLKNTIRGQNRQNNSSEEVNIHASISNNFEELHLVIEHCCLSIVQTSNYWEFSREAFALRGAFDI